jgi:Tfp pilus assembly protein PilO
MALLPQDRRGQMLLAVTVFAAASLYFVYDGTPVGGVPGLSDLARTRDSLQVQIDSLDEVVRRAQRDVQQGTLQQLEQRLVEYRTMLDMMRQLVPATVEVPNLLDDITSRAKVRGAKVVNFVPQPVESGSPFDTQRFRFTVTGQYDQVGEFLTDVASLNRIIVPYDVRMERIQSPTADTSLRANQAMLQVNFFVRTYVKAPVDTTAAQRQAGGAAARRSDDD